MPIHTQRLTWSACVLVGMYGLLLTTLHKILPDIGATFGVGTTGQTRLNSLMFVGYLVTPFAAALLAEWFGKRRVLVSGTLALVAGLAMMGVSGRLEVAWSYTLACWVMFVLGVSNGVIESIASATICDCNPGRATHWLNVAQFVFAVGAVIGPVLGGAVVASGHWSSCFFIMAGMAVAASAMLVSSGRFPHTQRISGMHLAETMVILRRGAFWGLWSAMALYGISQMTVLALAEQFARTRFGLEPLETAPALSGYWLAMFAGRLVINPVIRWLGECRTIAASCLTAAAGVALVMAAGNFPLAVAGFVIFGLGQAGLFGTVLGLTAVTFPRRATTAIGLAVTGGGLGAATGPWVVSKLIDSGWVEGLTVGRSFIVAVAALVVFAAVAILLERTGAVVQETRRAGEDT